MSLPFCIIVDEGTIRFEPVPVELFIDARLMREGKDGSAEQVFFGPQIFERSCDARFPFRDKSPILFNEPAGFILDNGLEERFT